MLLGRHYAVRPMNSGCAAVSPVMNVGGGQEKRKNEISEIFFPALAVPTKFSGAVAPTRKPSEK